MTQITNFNKLQLYTSCQKDVKLTNSTKKEKQKEQNKKKMQYITFAWDLHGRDRMVVGFTTTYVYNQCLSALA
jgi:hypothetical protein